jgi:multiple sugar transport system permease protein
MVVEAGRRTLELPPRGVRSPRGRRYLWDREGVLAPLLLLPSVVYILALVAVPFMLAIAFALSDVTVGDPSYNFVGLRNFAAILHDATFRRALGNTVAFTAISMVLVIVLSKALALILVSDFKGKRIVRFCVLLPWTTPVALAAVVWLWLLDSLFSPIDWVLRALELLHGNVAYLGQPGLAMASVIVVQTWRITPLAAVIVMAGLVAIPDEITDAAKVDGAGFWRTLFEVTIPLNLPVMAVAALFGVILEFTDMSIVYVLTRGGPIDATQVLASWAFYRGIEGGDLAQGAAIALFLFPVCLAAAIGILRAVRRMQVW